MQVLVTPTGVSIHEVSAADFAPLCWEAHPAVRGELAGYLHGVVEREHGALFAAFDGSGACAGRVAVEFRLDYVSRGKQCPTFGWLDGNDEAVVAALLEVAAQWSLQLATKLGKRFPHLRGPISCPKNIGGLGCQVEGFEMPRMHSVSTNRPELGRWIEAAGFKPDAPYACVDVSDAPKWDSAKVAPGYSITYWTRDEWRAREQDFGAALRDAFAGILPDSNGTDRLTEILDTMGYHPDSRYMNPVAIGPDGSIAGGIVCTPNLYDAWDGRPVTGANVDTIFIAQGHRRVGLMSALNNLGRVNTQKYLGWAHVEGTAIWLANEKAVMTIFPHGRICRRHVVFQKHLKFSAEKAG